MSIDLYSLFSDDDDFVKESKPKAKSVKKGTNTNKAEKRYELPMEIVLDGRKYTFTAEEVGIEQPTAGELLATVGRRWRWHPSDISRLVFDKDEQAYVTYLKTGAVKGTLTLKENSVFCFGSAEIDIAGLADEENGTIEIETLQESFRKEYPSYYPDKSNLWKQISILHSASTGIIVPILPADPVENIPFTDLEKLSFLTPDHIIIDIERERLIKVIQERNKPSGDGGKEESDQETHLSSDTEPGSVNEEEPVEDTADCEKQVLTPFEITKLLEEEHIWLGDQAILSKTGVAGLYSILQKPETERSKSVTPPPKEKYPVKGTVLSVYYAHYELDPILFDGKEEVEKSDLLAFLVKQGHREYEYTEVRIKYVKKGNLILVSSSGSSKGAHEIRCMSEFPRWDDIKKQLATLGKSISRQTVNAGIRGIYELVDTPMFTVALPKVEESLSYFLWKLPKIPRYIYEQGRYISLYIFDIYKTEDCLDLYFSIKNRCFLWNMPCQRAFKDSVMTFTEPYLESTDLSGLIKVGQIHSHGIYPAFFSYKDDCDEMIPGIYGVWGKLQEDPISFILRAVTGVGQFLRLGENLIFEEGEYDLIETEKDYLEGLADQRMEQMFGEEDYACICIRDFDVLLLEEEEIYSADVYCKCNLFVYDIDDGKIRPHISGDEDMRPRCCILSDHELGPQILNCGLGKEDWVETGERKSLIEYLSR